MNAPQLCPEHAEEWGKWLDYRPPATVKLVQIGNDPADARRARYEQWRNTIRTQQQLIRDACAAQC